MVYKQLDQSENNIDLNRVIQKQKTRLHGEHCRTGDCGRPSIPKEMQENAGPEPVIAHE